MSCHNLRLVWKIVTESTKTQVKKSVTKNSTDEKNGRILCGIANLSKCDNINSINEILKLYEMELVSPS